MDTAAALREDREWLEQQGVNPLTLRHATWYWPDGTPIPDLPSDYEHRQMYRAKGWTLKPSPGPSGRPSGTPQGLPGWLRSEGGRGLD